MFKNNVQSHGSVSENTDSAATVFERPASKKDSSTSSSAGKQDSSNEFTSLQELPNFIVGGVVQVANPSSNLVSERSKNLIKVAAVDQNSTCFHGLVLKGNDGHFNSIALCEQEPSLLSMASMESTHPQDTSERGTSTSMLSLSSATSSRPLEWDSAADVGYNGTRMSSASLGTLERIAIGNFASSFKLNTSSLQTELNCNKYKSRSLQHLMQRKRKETNLRKLSISGTQKRSESSKSMPPWLKNSRLRYMTNSSSEDDPKTPQKALRSPRRKFRKKPPLLVEEKEFLGVKNTQFDSCALFYKEQLSTKFSSLCELSGNVTNFKEMPNYSASEQNITFNSGIYEKRNLLDPCYEKQNIVNSDVASSNFNENAIIPSTTLEGSEPNDASVNTSVDTFFSTDLPKDNMNCNSNTSCKESEFSEGDSELTQYPLDLDEPAQLSKTLKSNYPSFCSPTADASSKLHLAAQTSSENSQSDLKTVTEVDSCNSLNINKLNKMLHSLSSKLFERLKDLNINKNVSNIGELGEQITKLENYVQFIGTVSSTGKEIELKKNVAELIIDAMSKHFVSENVQFIEEKKALQELCLLVSSAEEKNSTGTPSSILSSSLSLSLKGLESNSATNSRPASKSHSLGTVSSQQHVQKQAPSVYTGRCITPVGGNGVASYQPSNSSKIFYIALSPGEICIPDCETSAPLAGVVYSNVVSIGQKLPVTCASDGKLNQQRSEAVNSVVSTKTRSYATSWKSKDGHSPQPISECRKSAAVPPMKPLRICKQRSNYQKLVSPNRVENIRSARQIAVAEVLTAIDQAREKLAATIANTTAANTGASKVQLESVKCKFETKVHDDRNFNKTSHSANVERDLSICEENRGVTYLSSNTPNSQLTDQSVDIKLLSFDTSPLNSALESERASFMKKSSSEKNAEQVINRFAFSELEDIEPGYAASVSSYHSSHSNINRTFSVSPKPFVSGQTTTDLSGLQNQVKGRHFDSNIFESKDSISKSTSFMHDQLCDKDTTVESKKIAYSKNLIPEKAYDSSKIIDNKCLSLPAITSVGLVTNQVFSLPSYLEPTHQHPYAVSEANDNYSSAVPETIDRCSTTALEVVHRYSATAHEAIDRYSSVARETVGRFSLSAPEAISTSSLLGHKQVPPLPASEASQAAKDRWTSDAAVNGMRSSSGSESAYDTIRTKDHRLDEAVTSSFEFYFVPNSSSAEDEVGVKNAKLKLKPSNEGKLHGSHGDDKNDNRLREMHLKKIKRYICMLQKLEKSLSSGLIGHNQNLTARQNESDTKTTNLSRKYTESLHQSEVTAAFVDEYDSGKQKTDIVSAEKSHDKHCKNFIEQNVMSESGNTSGESSGITKMEREVRKLEKLSQQIVALGFHDEILKEVPNTQHADETSCTFSPGSRRRGITSTSSVASTSSDAVKPNSYIANASNGVVSSGNICSNDVINAKWSALQREAASGQQLVSRECEADHQSKTTGMQVKARQQFINIGSYPPQLQDGGTSCNVIPPLLNSYLTSQDAVSRLVHNSPRQVSDNSQVSDHPVTDIRPDITGCLALPPQLMPAMFVGDSSNSSPLMTSTVKGGSSGRSSGKDAECCAFSSVFSPEADRNCEKGHINSGPEKVSPQKYFSKYETLGRSNTSESICEELRALALADHTVNTFEKIVPEAASVKNYVGNLRDCYGQQLVEPNICSNYIMDGTSSCKTECAGQIESKSVQTGLSLLVSLPTAGKDNEPVCNRSTNEEPLSFTSEAVTSVNIPRPAARRPGSGLVNSKVISTTSVNAPHTGKVSFNRSFNPKSKFGLPIKQLNLVDLSSSASKSESSIIVKSAGKSVSVPAKGFLSHTAKRIQEKKCRGGRSVPNSSSSSFSSSLSKINNKNCRFLSERIKQTQHHNAEHTFDASVTVREEQAVLSLQEALRLAKPQFIAAAEERRSRIVLHQTVRREAQSYNNKLLASLPSQMQESPRTLLRLLYRPVVSSPLISYKELRAQNRRLITKLPEMKRAQKQREQQVLAKANKCRWKLYTQKLREKAVQGRVAHAHREVVTPAPRDRIKPVL